MKDANNIRNRYRRMRESWTAYGWAGIPTLRSWAVNWGQNPHCYSAQPHHLNYVVRIGKGKPS